MGKIIGIDPGINGAITCIDEAGKVEFVKIMPKNAAGLDGNCLNDILQGLIRVAMF